MKVFGSPPHLSASPVKYLYSVMVFFISLVFPLVLRLWTCHLQQSAQLPEGRVCSICGDQNPQVYKKGKVCL